MNKELIKLWGLTIEQIFDGYQYHWTTFIRDPFWFNGKKVIGFNQKALDLAKFRGVEQVTINFPDNKQATMFIPTKCNLKDIIKNKMYEDRPSKFENGKPMRIYYIEYMN